MLVKLQIKSFFNTLILVSRFPAAVKVAVNLLITSNDVTSNRNKNNKEEQQTCLI